MESDKEVRMILVGNKTDLGNLRSVSYDQGQELA